MSISGAAADAKAVGDALGSVSSTIYTEIKHNLIDWDAEDVQNNATWTSDGNTSTTSSQIRSITDFFPVDDGRKLCLNYINRVKFFTAEKTFISTAVGQDALEHILVDVPSTAVYAKAQVPNDRKSTAYIYIYMGKYYEYSAYEDDVTSAYIADEKTADAIAESVTSDIISGDIDMSGTPDNSIPMDAIDGVDVFHWNVVDDSKLLIGFNLNGNTGELSPSSTTSTLIYVTTDYCKVEPSVTYKGTSGVVCGYDASKNFVSKLTEASYHTYTIPSGVRYVRIAEQHQRAWENQNIYFMRDGYGKSFGTADQYPYNNAFPVLATEDGKKGFRLYMDLEPWRDKRILVIGDSYSAPGTWQAEMCENFSAILDNHAVSGAGWCTGRTKTVHELAEAVTENPDIVIITIGGNDCNDQTIEIGNFVNGTAESDYSDSTLYGAMQKALTYIRNRWTGVPVYIGFTPAGNGLVKSQSKERVSAFIEAMKDVCISYACVYIETRTCGIAYPLVQNDVIFQKYAYDSHPSEEGQHQIARYMTDLMSGYKAARSWYTPESTS